MCRRSLRAIRPDLSQVTSPRYVSMPDWWDYTTCAVSAKPAVPWCVLIVEDDAALRDVLADMPVSAGHVVEQASVGPEGVPGLADGQFASVRRESNPGTLNVTD